MNKKRRIGFDFDKIFVNYPPLIPDFVINYFYKKRNGSLTYRMPGKFERQLRIISHLPLFRSPIKENINSLKRISADENNQTYLVSSRFSFLKNKTNKWLSTNMLNKYFDGIYFNFENNQPHLFKDKVIKKEKIQQFIDDDLDLLIYLSKQNPKVKFYWITKTSVNTFNKNIIPIKTVEEFVTKYL